MDDRNAFERQLAREVMRMAGPEPRFDAPAVARSAMATAAAGRWSVVTRFRGGLTAPMERGFTMFSALRFIAAGVILALFGSFLYSGVLTTQRSDEVIPAAMTESEQAPADPMAPAVVTIDPVAEPNEVTRMGTLSYGERGSGASRLEDLRQEWVWESSDPRLSGVVTTVDNWHEWNPSGQEMRVEATALELVNDGGRWTGTGTGLGIESLGSLPHGRLASGMILLSGADGYEGLSALVYMDWADPVGDPVVYGVIFPGEMPYPELPVE